MGWDDVEQHRETSRGDFGWGGAGRNAAMDSPKPARYPPRLLPSIVVTNGTSETWENVSVSINKAFVHYHFQPLAPGETLVAPLERFVTKGGNVNFRPSTQEVRRITVFAQLPSNERAVLNRGVEATSTGWSVKPWSGGR